MLGLGEPPLGEVGQLEIVEEHVEEFSRVRTKRNASSLLAASFGLPPASRERESSPSTNLVAGQHLIAEAAAAAMQRRLAHSVERNADLAALHDVADVAALRGMLHRALHQRLARRRKRCRFSGLLLPGFRRRSTMCMAVFASRLSRLASPACTIRPGGGPAARYSRGPPCAGRTLHASFRSPRPSSSRRK